MTTTFTGKFEGLGHTIGNLTIASSDANVGLFALAHFNASLPSGFDSSIWGSNPSINGGFPYLLALPPR